MLKLIILPKGCRIAVEILLPPGKRLERKAGTSVDDGHDADSPKTIISIT